jgi:hypothetical protein
MQYRVDGIFGELRDLNDLLIAITLEHAYPLDDDDGFYPKIPVGTYHCERGIHQLEGMPNPFETFEITQVPNHSKILFHWGNWNDDSSGCVLLGKALAPSTKGQMITDSRAMFAKFMQLEINQATFRLTVLG